MSERDTCERMVSMNVPELGVTGMPQMVCGAPIPRASCPFGGAHDVVPCPYAKKERGALDHLTSNHLTS